LVVGAAYYVKNLQNSAPSQQASAPVVTNTQTTDVGVQQYGQSADQKQAAVRRCGDLPEETSLGIKRGHYTIFKGFEWSPNCQYIAWSEGESGTSVPEATPPPWVAQPYEGLYLYDKSSQKVTKLFAPRRQDEVMEFQKWESPTTFSVLVAASGKTEVRIYNAETHSWQ
jgi:hypothetical protein